MTVPEPVLRRWGSIDDYLGDAADRFFGSGYKHTRPQISGLRIHHKPDHSTLDGQAALEIAGPWSRKGTSARRPHLATTDAVVLTLDAVTALARTRYGARPADGPRLVRLELSATGEPVEDGLDALPIVATLQETPHEHVAFSAKIATMRARGRVLRPGRSVLMAEVDREDGLSLPAQESLGSRSYQRRTVSLTDVLLRPENLAEARFFVRPDDGAENDAGEAVMSLNDVFVGALQLGQLLLYELDGVERARSNTLWMRRTQFVVQERPSLELAHNLVVRLVNDRVLRMKGVRWRCADVRADLGGSLSIDCSVTHQLPGS